MTWIALLLLILAACGPEVAHTPGGYACEDAGATCDPRAPTCAPGLDCVPKPGAARAGTCASRCDADRPCAVGACDLAAGTCRDADGLPTGLCDGTPSCAGDPCESACGGGLACVFGACALACRDAADCAPDRTCRAGACFAGDALADPCDD